MQQVAPMINSNVRELRLKQGLTQRELSEMSGVAKRYLQEIEAGTKTPSVTIARKLKDALGCSWNRLLD